MYPLAVCGMRLDLAQLGSCGRRRCIHVFVRSPPNRETDLQSFLFLWFVCVRFSLVHIDLVLLSCCFASTDFAFVSFPCNFVFVLRLRACFYPPTLPLSYRCEWRRAISTVQPAPRHVSSHLQLIVQHTKHPLFFSCGTICGGKERERGREIYFLPFDGTLERPRCRYIDLCRF